jgi:hypothetical protein
MRSLEVHVIETDSDLNYAIQAGVVLVEHLEESECSDCGLGVAHSNGEDAFDAFCVVLDDSDRDWLVCLDCASSVVEGDFRQATTKPEVFKPPTVYSPAEEELDFF